MKRNYGQTATRVALAAIFCFTLAVGQQLQFNGSSYKQNATLHDDLDMYWTVDTETDTFRVALRVKTSSGWAGIGFSEMGGMEGSDIVYYETATGNITDAYALTAGAPVVDECSQDWTLVSAEVGSDGLVFEAVRPLETTDPQDRVLVDDTVEGVVPTRVLAAWGEEDVVSYHSSNIAKTEVVLFGDEETSVHTDPLFEVKVENSSSFFDVKTKNFTIPAMRTWYENTCINASDLPANGEFHAIGFEGLIHEATGKYVHHLVLQGYHGTDTCGVCDGAPNNSSSSGNDDMTDSPSNSSDSNSYPCGKFTAGTLYGWAPGVSGLLTPDDVGFRFGTNEGGFQSIEVQTHYNNPDLDEGLQDNSGVRVYYTEEPRAMDAGILQLGDPFLMLEDMEIPDGKSKFAFECPQSCLEENFEAENVTIFGHLLHMHATGQHMVTRQYRNDVLINTVRVEYYSFDQAGGYNSGLNGTEMIQKGDRFETDCYYDTAFSETEEGEPVVFGLGSENEMCMEFLYYYPAQPIPYSTCAYPVCSDVPPDNATLLDADSTLNRTFGIMNTCAAATGDSKDNNTVGDISSSRVLVPGHGPLVYVFTASVLLLGFCFGS